MNKKGGVGTRVTKKKKMLDALSKSLGIVSHAAKKANVARKNHYKWLKEDPKYREAVEEIEQEQLDFAESKLFVNIQEKDVASIIFYLKTKGKSRGYIERYEAEVTGADAFLEAMKEASKIRKQMENEQS